MKQKRFIGYKSEKKLVEMDRSEIRRYAACIGSKNALHFDPEHAKKLGYRDIVAPVSIVTTYSDCIALIGLLKINPRNILHSEQSIDIARPILAGDSFVIYSEIKEIYERPIGNATTGFLAIESYASDEDGESLFTTRRVLAIRGGFRKKRGSR